MDIRNRIVGLKQIKASCLQANPKNWRVHNDKQRQALRGALSELGIVNAVIARHLGRGNYELIDGHLRAEELGNAKVPVLVVDLDEDEAKKALATLDPIGTLAETDAEMLASLRSEIEVDSDALVELIEELAGVPPAEIGEVVEDEVPEPPKDPVTKAGDLWLLGEHRLLCGDSTKAEDVGRVMDGVQSGACITDPPYNVGLKYGEKVDDAKHQREYEEFCRSWWNCVPFACCIVTPGWNNQSFWLSTFPPQSSGVWIKTNAMTRGTVTQFNCWEPILFYGCRTRARANDVFTFAVGMQKGVGNHPCPKPVNMWAELIECYTNEGDVIYEPFAGSGTTIIAAQQLNRRCYGIEIDPAYCDVIVERWENLTGGKAKRAGATKRQSKKKAAS